MSKKKLMAIITAVALVLIGTVVTVLVLVLNREGIAVSSGTFSAASSGVGFTFGVEAGGRNGISNISNNTWSASLNRANGSSRVDYTFTAANLNAMTVRNENAEGSVSLTFTQGNTVKTFDITGDFNGNIDMSGFAAGRIRLRLVFENARNVNTLISW